MTIPHTKEESGLDVPFCYLLLPYKRNVVLQLLVRL
jgi:hypothetical protein